MNSLYHSKVAVKKIHYAFFLAFWVIIYVLYYSFDVKENGLQTTLLQESFTFLEDLEPYNDTSDYLINTEGCYIPNYGKTLKIKEAKMLSKTCGIRAIFLEKVSENTVTVHIDEVKMKKHSKGLLNYNCCYRFVMPAVINGKKDYRKIMYSSCNSLKNESKIDLQEEVIIIRCEHAKHVFYEDAYVFVKSKKREKQKRGPKWNVLVLGLDTMSRARLISSMPKTAEFLRDHHWLDFRGYQKVGYNTFPNIMALLTGRNMSDVNAECHQSMDTCNNILIWKHFKDAGYYTATGEDFLRLPDTFTRFGGFSIAPTDHYIRPFFLTGENLMGNFVCTGKKPSAKHLLDYALDFCNSYRNDSFFGMFWLNSLSHNLENVPTLFDTDMTDFFRAIHKIGITDNTFILFLSDHGLRYGPMRIPYESYYEERLPMLYALIPNALRKNIEIFKNILVNQSRLVTPYDLYATMINILKISSGSENSRELKTSHACPNCSSILSELPAYRTCNDVNVSEKWCTCHSMIPVNQSSVDAKRAVQAAVNNIHDMIKRIETIKCQQCADLQLKTVFRVHKYRTEGSTVYTVAFEMTPGDVSYEASVEQNGDTYSVLDTTQTISEYNKRGSCIINPVHRAYCICMKQKCK